MGSAINAYDYISFALRSNTEALARLQEQVATGSRINRASDEPSAAYRVLGLNSQQRSLANYIESLSNTISTMDMASNIISSGDSGMVQTIAKVELYITQMMSGTYSESQRKISAGAINSFLEQMVSLANTERIGQYLFGGSNARTVPYVVERTDGEITKVTYQGGDSSRNAEIAPGLNADILYAGDDIFSSKNRGTPVFLGSTDAKAGSGTSSVTGDTWLTVTHDGSNFKLSIDDGLSEVTVPGAGDISNLAVTHSETGKVLYVDATDMTNTNATGVQFVQMPGTYDVFDVVISIRDILKNERLLETEQIKQLMLSSLDSLEEISDLLTGKSSAAGLNVKFLENVHTNLVNMEFDTKMQADSLQQADIADLAIDLARREVLYQMTLSVAGRLLSMSLLDFLR